MGNSLTRRNSSGNSQATLSSNGSVNSSAINTRNITSKPSGDLKQSQSNSVKSNSKPLAPWMTQEDSDFECPICYVNYSALNTSICCKQVICTGCYDQVPFHEGNTKLCPFCGDKNMNVTYEPTSIITQASPTAIGKDSPAATLTISTPTSTSKGKDIFIPLATSDDRKQIENEILRNQKNFASDFVRSTSPESSRRIRSDRSYVSPATSATEFLDRLEAMSRQSSGGRGVNARGILRTSRSASDSPGSSAFLQSSTSNSSSTTPAPGPFLISSPPARMQAFSTGSSESSPSSGGSGASFGEHSRIRSLRDLEELMLQEAMRISLQASNSETQTQSEIHNSSATAINSNLNTASSSSADMLNSELGLDVDFIDYRLEMSEEEQLTLALQMSLRISEESPSASTSASASDSTSDNASASVLTGVCTSSSAVDSASDHASDHACCTSDITSANESINGSASANVSANSSDIASDNVSDSIGASASANVNDYATVCSGAISSSLVLQPETFPVASFREVNSTSNPVIQIAITSPRSSHALSPAPQSPSKLLDRINQALSSPTGSYINAEVSPERLSRSSDNDDV